MGLPTLKIPRKGEYANKPKAAKGELVCTTGNWGMLGSWIVKLLLHHGYYVKCTIPLSPEETSILLSLPEAEERLELATVDLLDYGSISDLFDRCTGVFHVPAPNYDINGVRDYPVDIIDEEVRGALNVVEACANTSSVRKLVLTSCLSSVLWDSEYYASGAILDEKNWSDLEFCRKKKLWSALGKTLAEKAAWALARDRGVDLVVMNPALVAGPKLPFRQISGKSSGMLDQTGIFAYVHVDDLAEAHVLAFEADEAAGRYICFEKLLTKADIVEAAKELYPNYPIAKRLEAFNPCVLSNEKLKSLGVKFEQSSF